MNCPMVTSPLNSKRSHNVNSLSRYCTNHWHFVWCNKEVKMKSFFCFLPSLLWHCSLETTRMGPCRNVIFLMTNMPNDFSFKQCNTNAARNWTIYTVSQKGATWRFIITLANVNRFSKFFYQLICEKILYAYITQISTLPAWVILLTEWHIDRQTDRQTDRTTDQ